MRKDYSKFNYENEMGFIHSVDAERSRFLFDSNVQDDAIHKTRVRLLILKGVKNLYAQGGKRLPLTLLEKSGDSKDRSRVAQSLERMYQQAKKNTSEYADLNEMPFEPDASIPEEPVMSESELIAKTVLYGEKSNGGLMKVLFERDKIEPDRVNAQKEIDEFSLLLGAQDVIDNVGKLDDRIREAVNGLAPKAMEIVSMQAGYFKRYLPK